MKITYLGQSWFIIEWNDKVFGIDIWLGCPTNPLSIDDIPKLDYSLCTHDHGDHGFKTMVELAKRDDAVFVGPYDMARVASASGATSESANIWGMFALDWVFQVALMPALHTSDTGLPCGFLITDGDKTIYHMGDTGFMSEFQMIADLYSPDVVMIPIWSRYTMDTRQAAYALDILKPKIAIPMHFNTFDKILADPKELSAYMKTRGTEVVFMEAGDVKSL